VTDIETTHEKFTEEDYALLRESWAGHHFKLDEDFDLKSQTGKCAT